MPNVELYLDGVSRQEAAGVFREISTGISSEPPRVLEPNQAGKMRIFFRDSPNAAEPSNLSNLRRAVQSIANQPYIQTIILPGHWLGLYAYNLDLEYFVNNAAIKVFTDLVKSGVLNNKTFSVNFGTPLFYIEALKGLPIKKLIFEVDRHRYLQLCSLIEQNPQLTELDIFCESLTKKHLTQIIKSLVSAFALTTISPVLHGGMRRKTMEWFKGEVNERVVRRNQCIQRFKDRFPVEEGKNFMTERKMQRFVTQFFEQSQVVSDSVKQISNTGASSLPQVLAESVPGFLNAVDALKMAMTSKTLREESESLDQHTFVQVEQLRSIKRPRIANG